MRNTYKKPCNAKKVLVYNHKLLNAKKSGAIVAAREIQREWVATLRDASGSFVANKFHYLRGME